MRSDYKYVDDACSICLTTTENGSIYLKEKFDDEFGFDEKDILVLFLAEIENDYLIVEGKTIGIDEIVSQFNTYMVETYPEPFIVSHEIVAKAFTDGFLGVRKVIWDE